MQNAETKVIAVVIGAFDNVKTGLNTHYVQIPGNNINDLQMINTLKNCSYHGDFFFHVKWPVGLMLTFVSFMKTDIISGKIELNNNDNSNNNNKNNS